MNLGVVRSTVCKQFRNAAASTEEEQATAGGQRGRHKGMSAQRPARRAIELNDERVHRVNIL